jgi:glycosyltransferase involved in cell wall biosynthesis
MSPHKNFSALIEAVKIIGEADFEIYIVGGGNTSVFKNSTIQLPTNVMLLGYVADEELKELYRNANCFIYPSLYEGFGLPPLEAMYNGCPVIVARSGALPEVCGDAAFYCDPYDPEDIAEKICLMMTNDNLRNEFREKGLSQARLYTWEKCARATLSTILEAINQ